MVGWVGGLEADFKSVKQLASFALVGKGERLERRRGRN